MAILTNLGYFVAWLSSIVILFGFLLFVPWNKTTMGRHMVAYSAVVATLMTWILIRMTFPDFEPWPWVRPAMAWLWASVLLWRAIYFARVQVRGKENGH